MRRHDQRRAWHGPVAQRVRPGTTSALYDVFVKIKQLFDPANLLNPGKVLTDDPHLTVRNLRTAIAKPPETISLQLRWKPDELWQAASRCNGCGHCRTQTAPTRMCPLFHVDPSEEQGQSARQGQPDAPVDGSRSRARKSATPEFKGTPTPVSTKQCQLECPSNVNIPQMMIEAKGLMSPNNGLAQAD